MIEYLKSSVEVLGIAKDAGRLIVEEVLAKVDEKLAEYCDLGYNDDPPLEK